MPPKLVLVLVGGNSETIHHTGMWELYKGQKDAADKPLLTSIRQHTGLAQTDIATYYFSWTGDDEFDRDKIFPSHWNWIFGGAQRIEESLKSVLQSLPARAQLVIVGWSNGGATAYELSCLLSRNHTVNLLVTMDPVAWTTKPCAIYSADLLATPKHWVNVYTRSSLGSRLRAGNIIALLGRAWNDDHLPSRPSESIKLQPGNHGDTPEMWTDKVVPSKTFREWARSFSVTP